MPARLEEINHAREEGIEFLMLTNPIEILTDPKVKVTGIRCDKMALGEPDSSGRRRPVPLPGADFTIACDTVIVAIGNAPNPLVSSTTEGLAVNRWGCIEVKEGYTATSRPGIFAGGDVVTGAATVILAMGAGKQAAIEIDRYFKGNER
jgi:glutamate synthase (NADPH/NADH) small chain